MSQETVEIVKRAWEAWHRDDLAANLDLLDPEVELYSAIEPFFEGTESVYRGHDGFRALWVSYRGEAFQRLEVRWDEFRDLGDSVLALGELKIIGQTSQAEVTTEFTQHLTFRGGKIASSRDFLSHAEGLKAAGLSE
jgi:ketosteroid isomerase-like protein